MDFAGLTVLQATELRNRFRKAGVDYRVVKNTLVKIALKGTVLDTDAFKSQLRGQTGIAWSYEEPSVAAKVIRDFRAIEINAAKLQVKCGVLENQLMAGPRVETELASLPGKDEVRAMLLAQLLAPMQKLVMQLNAPAQNLSFALDARKRQLEEQG
jgi:large subunit ribosomal protein L10